MIRRPLVEVLHRSEDTVVHGLRLRPSLDASGDHDRNPTGAQEFGCDLDDEAVRHVARFFLIRHHRHVARVRAADDAGVPAGFLAEGVDVLGRVPADCAGHRCRRPHQPQPRTKRRGDRQGQDALDVEEQNDGLLVDRREHDLLHPKRGMRVGERRRFGTHTNRRHDVAAVNLERVSFEPERQREVVEDFQRIDPRFDRSVLVAEHRGTATDHVEERAVVRRTA